MVEKIMNSELRKKINSYIKNGLDISELIKDVSIKGEDLSYSKIKSLYRVDTDISGCNFSHSIIGSEDTQTTIIKCKMNNCNFESAKFIGKVWMRNCDARNCNFKNSDVHTVSYNNTNFLGSTFCNSIITIGTKQGIGAIFPSSMFQELTKGWKGYRIEVVMDDKKQIDEQE